MLTKRRDYPTSLNLALASQRRMVLAFALSLVIHGGLIDFGNQLLHIQPRTPPALNARLLPPPPAPRPALAPTPIIIPEPKKIRPPRLVPPVARKRPVAAKKKPAAVARQQHKPQSNSRPSVQKPGQKLPAQAKVLPGISAEAVRAATKRLADNLLYPIIAVKSGLQGEARVLIVTDSSGQIIAVQLDASSGYQILDDAALAAARRLERLPDAGRGEAVLRILFRLRP